MFVLTTFPSFSIQYNVTTIQGIKWIFPHLGYCKSSRDDLKYWEACAQVIFKHCGPLFRGLEHLSVGFRFKDPRTSSPRTSWEKCGSQHVGEFSAQLSEFKGLTHTTVGGNALGNVAFEFTQEPTGELLLGTQLICK